MVEYDRQKENSPIRMTIKESTDFFKSFKKFIAL